MEKGTNHTINRIRRKMIMLRKSSNLEIQVGRFHYHQTPAIQGEVSKDKENLEKHENGKDKIKPKKQSRKFTMQRN